MYSLTCSEWELLNRYKFISKQKEQTIVYIHGTTELLEFVTNLQILEGIVKFRSIVLVTKFGIYAPMYLQVKQLL